MIYPTNDSMKEFLDSSTEVNKKDVEELFIDEVCNVVVKAMNVPESSSQLMKPLLKNTIEDGLRPLIEQLQAYTLDEATKQIKNDFMLKSKPDHGLIIQHSLDDMKSELEKTLKNG